MMSHELISLLASALGFYAFYPYLRDILKGRTKPHIFTWGIWGLLTSIAFFAQLAEGAGPGAWVTGCFALFNFTVVGLAFRYGEKTITRSDWAMLMVSLLAVPLWVATKDPLWSVVMVCVIDILAFAPTFRKSWSKPREETLQTYILCSASYFMSLFALETFNLTTILYPATLIGTNAAFVLMVMQRRRQKD